MTVLLFRPFQEEIMSKVRTRILLLGLVSLMAAAGAQAGVRPGDFATDFTALNWDGSYIHLWDYLGDVIVLDFSTLW